MCIRGGGVTSIYFILYETEFPSVTYIHCTHYIYIHNTHNIHTSPLLNNTKLCVLPVATLIGIIFLSAVMAVGRGTSTGICVDVVLPIPNCPNSFLPT